MKDGLIPPQLLKVKSTSTAGGGGKQRGQQRQKQQNQESVEEEDSSDVAVVNGEGEVKEAEEINDNEEQFNGDIVSNVDLDKRADDGQIEEPGEFSPCSSP